MLVKSLNIYFLYMQNVDVFPEPNRGLGYKEFPKFLETNNADPYANSADPFANFFIGKTFN